MDHHVAAMEFEQLDPYALERQSTPKPTPKLYDLEQQLTSKLEDLGLQSTTPTPTTAHFATVYNGALPPTPFISRVKWKKVKPSDLRKPPLNQHGQPLTHYDGTQYLKIVRHRFAEIPERYNMCMSLLEWYRTKK